MGRRQMRKHQSYIPCSQRQETEHHRMIITAEKVAFLAGLGIASSFIPWKTIQSSASIPWNVRQTGRKEIVLSSSMSDDDASLFMEKMRQSLDDQDNIEEKVDHVVWYLEGIGQGLIKPGDYKELDRFVVKVWAKYPDAQDIGRDLIKKPQDEGLRDSLKQRLVYIFSEDEQMAKNFRFHGISDSTIESIKTLDSVHLVVAGLTLVGHGILQAIGEEILDELLKKLKRHVPKNVSKLENLKSRPDDKELEYEVTQELTVICHRDSQVKNLIIQASQKIKPYLLTKAETKKVPIYVPSEEDWEHMRRRN